MTQRYPEIDLLRTIAVLMMLLFHYAFDLRFFYGWHIDVFSGPWFWLGRLCAILFLILVGVSFVISWERASHRSVSRFWKLYPKYLRRALFILGCGMLITAVTYWQMPSVYIRFGILHLIGTSILILPFLVRFREANALVGVILIMTGQWMQTMRVATSMLLPFGIPYEGFSSLDYYPLLPWFGVILIGAALGHFLYIRCPGWRAKVPSTKLPASPAGRQVPRLTWAGRNALLIYMLHQPIFLGFLYLFT